MGGLASGSVRPISAVRRQRAALSLLALKRSCASSITTELIRILTPCCPGRAISVCTSPRLSMALGGIYFARYGVDDVTTRSARTGFHIPLFGNYKRPIQVGSFVRRIR
jgi:hypothetical protein